FDVGSVTDTNATSNNVNENATVGTVVGITAAASDADSTNNTITYSLFDNDGGRFAIDSTTGIVTVAGAINREVDGASRSITVRATSSDGSHTDQIFSIAINDVDEFDVGSVTDTNATSNNVNENASVGTVVGITASASDADSTNNTITYSLFDNDGGRFAIDSTTGVVTVAGAINREVDGASRSITVRATSSDGSHTDQIFSIAINDVDEFDVGSVTDTNAISNNVNENASAGTAVGITASASDADSTNNTITYSLFDNDGGRFAIDSTTGVVTVAGAINREVDGASRSITVRATSSDGSYNDQIFSIAINDVDEFDVGSVTDTNATSNNVNENANVGTLVGITASASDADSTNNTITYSLFDNDGGRFAIDSTTGIVTVAGAINREVDGASRSITVRATSSDGSYSDQIFSIAINDVDEFDVGSVTDTNAISNNVSENATVGTIVGITAAASDADSTNNTITYSLFDNDGGRFAIDSTTGVVTVAGAINREADGASRSITVRATSSDGSYTDQIFSIAINDVDEFDVGSVTDTNASSNNVNENASVGTVVGITAAASDADATTNTITYSLFDNDGGRFAIDSNTGVITVASAIDREADGASRSVTIRATSTDGSYTDQVFSIAINDVDEFDVGAVSDTNATSNDVNENATVGTVVGITAAASDVDATNNAITYSLFDDDGGRFAIDSTTGIVTVAGTIDREADGASRSITVRATSTDGSYTDQVFSIAINDVDEFDVGTVTDADSPSNNVNENATVGTLVGITAAASDLDATNNTITYALFDNDGGRFAIDSNTGVVSVASAIDRETDGASRSITIRATSTDGSYTDQVFSIAINDVDEFDVGAVTDTNATSNNVNENASVGTVVGITAAASDVDATNNAITYSLFDDDGGRFAIDSTTGIVTVAGAIDREADGASRSITVRATSTDGSYTDQVFSIAINDVDEFNVGTVTDADSASNNVDENANVGTLVGITAAASDGDATNNAITYSLFDNDGGRFAIDSTTGIVTVAGAIDREVDGASRSITIRATSADGSFTDQVMSIAINDLDEFDVGSVTDANASTNAVNENAAIGTTVGLVAYANDLDATTSTISYSLVNNDGGRFAIDSVTGTVTVADSIDREVDGAVRSIVVRATSADGSFTDQNFSIQINDVDEFDVTSSLDTDSAANEILENTLGNATVGLAVIAQDLDATTNIVTYSLDNDAGGRFSIDAVTGVVTQNGPLDHETTPTLDIIVRATSDDGSFSQTSFTIHVLNANEFPFAIDDAYNSGENAQATLNVMSNDYDLDPGDQIQLVSAQLTQGLGSVQVISNILVYNPGNAYDYLSVGESVLVVINYQIEDSFGLTDNASVAITIAGQRDQLAVTVGNVQGSEDSPFAWPISVNMVDTNGETLTDVVVRGLPVGTEVTDQFGMTRIVGNTGAVSVFGMDLGSLQYLTPHNFSGLIQATVDVVSSLGNNFIQSFPCTVDIAPVADIGEIFATGGRTDLGSSLALPISYYIEDMDGSEIPTLGISGIPQGMRITDGTNNYVSQNATQWANLNGWNLTSLRLVTDGGIPGDYNFTYRLTIVEGANGSTSVIQQTIKVVVDEVLPQISSGSQASPQTIPLTSTSSQETSPADEPQTAAVATEETAEMSTTELNPENITTNEVTNYVFETDSDIEREFDSLLRATANNTSARQTPTFEFSLSEQFGDTVDGSQSGNGVRTMEEFEMAVEALQEITETEELLRNQSDLEVETQQQFSIQSSLIAFWNLIRANISPQETNTESDARNEIRVTQRTDRRNE
ncbi:MAG: cadherin repeat domain-containing protein, partial [Planctomycetes bacterium]|nr:cadherin repeat domain-containing protein [Planctomycetota bacterium]